MADTNPLVLQAPANTEGVTNLVFGATVAAALNPIDLVFDAPPVVGAKVNFVFGSDKVEAPPADALITLDGTLPALTATFAVTVVVNMTMEGTLPALTADFSCLYISNTTRPTVGKAGSDWQKAVLSETGNQAFQQNTMRHPVGIAALEQEAEPLQSIAKGNWNDSDHTVRPSTDSHFQEGMRTPSPIMHGTWQDANRSIRPTRRMRHQDGNGMGGRRLVGHWQDAYRDRRNFAAEHHQKAVPLSRRYSATLATGVKLRKYWEADYQEAMRPPAGMYVAPPIVIPPKEPCYTPNGQLVFETLWDGSTQLVFKCAHDDGGGIPEPGASVVVPIRKVYIVLNAASLRRVDGNILLPTFKLDMSLDVDSWTWTFSASLPGRALADLEPAEAGDPVIVEAMINGVAYQMQVEKRSRDRSFGTSAIRISGRGLSSALDAPYSPVMNFGNSEARTAQQLMNDVLQVNGVSLGWTVDWQAVDWSVPTGLFSHQGVYMSALNAIAAAAGSYVQPHPVGQTLHVLPRYPALPWEWGTVTPDFEIPSAVATVEGIEWIEKALYNRVFVSGTTSGVLGQVTRTGTDGGLIAPMIADALITTSAAARQRGGPVLADTGAQANVTIKLPVLDATGIITPGKFVKYVDGGTTHFGITRSVQVEVDMPDIWQTIGVETHV